MSQSPTSLEEVCVVSSLTSVQMTISSITRSSIERMLLTISSCSTATHIWTFTMKEPASKSPWFTTISLSLRRLYLTTTLWTLIFSFLDKTEFFTFLNPATSILKTKVSFTSSLFVPLWSSFSSFTLIVPKTWALFFANYFTFLPFCYFFNIFRSSVFY